VIALNGALVVLTPLFYLGAVFAYWYGTKSEGGAKSRAGIVLAAAALGLHALLFTARAAILGHFPLTTVYDSLSFLALVMTAMYVLIEAFSRVRTTGLYLVILPCALTTFACAVGPHEPKPNPTFVTPFFLLHVIPAGGGIAAIVVSACYGILYLRLAHAIQKKHWDGLFRRLPDLAILARMNFWAGVLGLLLMTAAIGWGATWYGDLFDQVRVTEPKIFMTLLIWTILLVPVGGKLARRFSDRATAKVAVVSLGLLVVSIVMAFLPIIGFHSHK
jgi:HemX protein